MVQRNSVHNVICAVVVADIGFANQYRMGNQKKE
jgi:hypothetical protein